jgi:hypothetical protein
MRLTATLLFAVASAFPERVGGEEKVSGDSESSSGDGDAMRAEQKRQLLDLAARFAEGEVSQQEFLEARAAFVSVSYRPAVIMASHLLDGALQ